jgi:hypothetical protein
LAPGVTAIGSQRTARDREAANAIPGREASARSIANHARARGSRETS